MRNNKNYALCEFQHDKAFIYKKIPKGKEIFFGSGICIDTSGNVLFQLPDYGDNYDNFCYCSRFDHKKGARVKKYLNEWDVMALINDKGEFLTDFIYDVIFFPENKDIIMAEEAGGHGLLDFDGNETVPLIYSDIFLDSSEPFIIAGKYTGEDEKYGVVDYNNNIVIPFEYEDAEDTLGDKLIFQKKGKWGVVDKNNNTLVEFKYDRIWYEETNNIFCVKLNDKWGLVDTENNVIQPFIYDNGLVRGDVFALKKDGRYALYSAAEKRFITDFIYLSEQDNKGWKPDKNTVVYYAGYDIIDTFGPKALDTLSQAYIDDNYWSGLILVKKDGKEGMVDTEGNIVIPIEYKNLNRPHEGLIHAQTIDDKEGYIDMNNNVIIPFGKYKSCESFSCGYAIVSSAEAGRVYIDKNDNILDINIEGYGR